MWESLKEPRVAVDVVVDEVVEAQLELPLRVEEQFGRRVLPVLGAFGDGVDPVRRTG
jgi:hypothetical protein